MSSSITPRERPPAGDGGTPNGLDYDRESQVERVPPRTESIPREIPEPSLMQQRRIDNDNGNKGSSSNSSGDESDGGDVGAEAESGTNEEEEPAENRDDPDRCVFCLENLPAVSRGIIPCGHTFCFTCIHAWVGKQSTCPLCNKEIRYITKTLTREEKEREKKRQERRKEVAKRSEEIAKQQGKEVHVKLSKSQRKRQQRQRNHCIEHECGVMTKKMRVRPCSQNRIRNQMRHAPHPQASRGRRRSNPPSSEEFFTASSPTSASSRTREPEQRGRGLPQNANGLRAAGAVSQARTTDAAQTSWAAPAAAAVEASQTVTQGARSAQAAISVTPSSSASVTRSTAPPVRPLSSATARDLSATTASPSPAGLRANNEPATIAAATGQANMTRQSAAMGARAEEDVLERESLPSA